MCEASTVAINTCLCSMKLGTPFQLHCSFVWCSECPLYVGFCMWAFVYVLCLLGHHSATSLGWIKVNKVLRSSMQVTKGTWRMRRTSTKLAPQYKEQSCFIIEWASCIHTLVFSCGHILWLLCMICILWCKTE